MAHFLPKGGDMDTIVNFLDQCHGSKRKIQKGDELTIRTKSGRVFNGILFDIKAGYVHTIEALGILVIFPINSISSIQLL